MKPLPMIRFLSILKHYEYKRVRNNMDNYQNAKKRCILVIPFFWAHLWEQIQSNVFICITNTKQCVDTTTTTAKYVVSCYCYMFMIHKNTFKLPFKQSKNKCFHCQPKTSSTFNEISTIYRMFGFVFNCNYVHLNRFRCIILTWKYHTDERHNLIKQKPNTSSIHFNIHHSYTYEPNNIHFSKFEYLIFTMCH